MGTLTDITTEINNGIRQPNDSTTSEVLKSTRQDDILAKRKSTNFMSPTLSSTHQNFANVSNAQNRNSTPSSATSKLQYGSSWMASAAKRVGFKRVGDGTPRSRKEGPSPKLVTFPDKIASPLYARLPDSPSLAQAPTRPLSEKPLPSPPIVRVANRSPIKEARCLIDASEKPLHWSPPGLPHKQEEWPVLSPEKLTSPGPSLKIPSDDKLPAPTSVASITSHNERYPTFDTTSSPKLGVDCPIVRKAYSSMEIRRKPMMPAAQAAKPLKTEVVNDKPDETPISPVATEPSTSITYSDLSASAIAIENPMKEPRHLGQPRQTRTSSLRARLSAGQLIKENSMAKPKIVGFTDLTTVNDLSSMPRKDRLHVPEENKTRPKGTKLHRKKSPEGSAPANRPPAQFVGGSRRALTYRPSSRSSLRSNSRATSPALTSRPSNREALASSISSGVPAGAVACELVKTAELRHSSIPIFRHTVSSKVSQKTKNMSSVDSTQQDEAHGIEKFHDDFEIFEDRAVEASPEKSNEEDVPLIIEGEKNSFTQLQNVPGKLSGLQVIEESPRQGYHVRRLSIASPENGPILKISQSADRLIMGDEAEKDNRLAFKISSSFVRPSSWGKVSLTESVVGLKNRHERPASSQSLPHSMSRIALLSRDSRDKKVKSAEIKYSLSTDHLRPHSAKSMAQAVRKSAENSIADDPFFDAQSTQDPSQADSPVSALLDTTAAHREKKMVIEESWISPMAKKQHNNPSGNAQLNKSSHLLAAHEDLDRGMNKYNQYSVATIPVHEASAVDYDPPVQLPNPTGKITGVLPSTPERPLGKAGDTSSSSFPPRTSSRTSPPDYTVKGSAKRSPISPSKVVRYTHSEFLSRQNQLGASKGVASSPLDISHAAVSVERDSMARESNKTQGSTSKGMLSNIRGLFHKRSSENELSSAMRSNKKGKQTLSITTNGSPFPPLCEIHPVHRPTLASASRSTVKGRKFSVFDPISNTPGTPSFISPLPSEISTTTTLAMQLLESARTERSSPKKERALELGTILVEAITQARDAEKAMEEAKHAARKAEVAHALCKKSVGDIANRVLEWRDETRV